MGRKPQALGLSKHSADSISLSMKFIVIQQCVEDKSEVMLLKDMYTVHKGHVKTN